jgi:MoaA/NifB/PqqE/SkfB family radical SAM enzyme
MRVLEISKTSPCFEGPGVEWSLLGGNLGSPTTAILGEMATNAQELDRDRGATGVASKAVEHEDAAHEKRNWVRLTYDCNDRCVFCLDAHTHDGTNRDREEIRAQILDGRRKGAERLILSGGEPTIHPDFVAFVRLGKMAGYRKVQTVTNGRMFAYREFLTRCVDAGLSEITFSIHGPNAKVHDALVGTKGAFEQEVRGLRHALDDGRVIVNIDVCVNRGNVKTLPELLRKFTAMGVREYDLLHVIPFGRAYTEGKETLFYDLEEMRPYLLEAFAWSKQPDMHVWLNRFPVQHLEGYENLIQDPYKLNDEVRGRKEEYGQLLERGIPLDCRTPHRCSHCYLEPLCDTLDEVRDTVATGGFDAVRVEPAFEASLAPIYGGDPASAKRSEQIDQVVQEARAGQVDPRLRLPVLASAKPVAYPPLPEQVERAGARTLILVGERIADLEVVAADFPTTTELELELDFVDGLLERIGPGDMLLGKRLVRVVVPDAAQAEALLQVDGSFEVVLDLARRNEAWLLGLERAPRRLALRQPTHERLTESAQDDLDLPVFFSRFAHDVPVEGVPPCIAGTRVRSRPSMLDAAMMTPAGRLEIFRFARRYILDRYRVKSLRCKTCVHASSCVGMHVNYVRAHGFACMQPIEREGSSSVPG